MTPQTACGVKAWYAAQAAQDRARRASDKHSGVRGRARRETQRQGEQEQMRWIA